MRIKRVRIINHNILHDFTLEFISSEKTGNQQHDALDLVVGVNGTGKSTLLRSLALIFQCLDEGKRTPAFGFDITYELTSPSGPPFEVSVRNIDPETQKPLPKGLLYWDTQNASTNVGRAVEIANFPSDSIPPLTVAFTSGSDKGWLLEDVQAGPVDEGNAASRLPERDDPNLVTRLQDLFVHEVPGRPVQPEAISGTTMSERFLFISSDLTPLVVLCGLLNDMTRSSPSLQEVLRACQIKALRGFSLKLRMNNDLLREDQKPFIRNLMSLAHHTVQTGSEYLLVFTLKIAQEDMTRSAADVKALYPQQILDGLSGDGLGMFQELMRLANPDGNIDPILREVHLFLESDREIPLDGETNEAKKAALYLFDWLSDGEQSFLGRLCLFSLLSNQQTLILLDEPEVHFNDYWKRKLIFTLNQALQGQSSHIIMTTHSSITLSDVSEQDIKVLKREADNRSYVTTPSLKTLGADPSDILVYIFGAEEAVGAHSVAFIRAQLTEIARMPANTVSDRQKRRDSLIKLRDTLGPSYWRYLVRRELLEEENQQNVSSS